MNINTSYKKVDFEHFTMHKIYFKNIDIAELELLFDMVYEQLYELNAAIICSTLIGSYAKEKIVNKSLTKVFNEVNWSINRITNTNQLSFSGYFTAVSNVNVKTIVTNTGIVKIFDTPDNRYCYIGLNEKSKKLNDDSIANALTLTGVLSENVIVKSKNTSLVVEAEDDYYEALAVKNLDKLHVETLSKFNGIIVNEEKTNTLMLSDIMNSLAIADLNKNEPDYLDAIFNEINKLLMENNQQWKHLIGGLLVYENKQHLTNFKVLCKQYKVPMAPFFFVQQSTQSALDFNFELTFSYALESEA